MEGICTNCTRCKRPLRYTLRLCATDVQLQRVLLLDGTIGLECTSDQIIESA